MRIILPCLPDPTDLVLMGEVIGDSSAMDWQLALARAVPVSDIPALIPLVAGEISTSRMTGFPVPRAMIGQSDWYGILPRTIGPMRQAGGRIEMITIGAPLTPNLDDVFVDQTQKWQATAFEIDKCGFPLLLNESKVIGAPEAFAQFMVPEPETMGNPVVNIPRGAVYRSGLAKRTTMPALPNSFGRTTLVDDFVESTRRWFVMGVTRDGTGATLGAARVLMARTDKVGINPDILASPVEGDVVSDANGNFLFQVPNDLPRWLAAYKAGAPDVAGITRNDVLPDVSTNIYLRNPTATDGPGGSAVYRVIGSPIVRRIGL